MLDGLERRVLDEGRRDEQHRYVDLVIPQRAGDRVVIGDALDLGAALAGRDAGHHLGAVLAHEAGMGAGLAAAQALHQDARGAVKQDAHASLVRSMMRATTSSMVEDAS